eukprot:GFYU01001835.1.p1 GENE.GFYU01001835.1~~GFYU01001835.1.p1  ORF type:complete len:1213 (-),score=500.97 GFYU01001835.1:64-3702(-)
MGLFKKKGKGSEARQTVLNKLKHLTPHKFHFTVNVVSVEGPLHKDPDNFTREFVVAWSRGSKLAVTKPAKLLDEAGVYSIPFGSELSFVSTMYRHEKDGKFKEKECKFKLREVKKKTDKTLCWVPCDLSNYVELAEGKHEVVLPLTLNKVKCILKLTITSRWLKEAKISDFDLNSEAMTVDTGMTYSDDETHDKLSEINEEDDDEDDDARGGGGGGSRLSFPQQSSSGPSQKEQKLQVRLVEAESAQEILENQVKELKDEAAAKERLLISERDTLVSTKKELSSVKDELRREQAKVQELSSISSSTGERTEMEIKHLREKADAEAAKAKEAVAGADEARTQMRQLEKLAGDLKMKNNLLASEIENLKSERAAADVDVAKQAKVTEAEHQRTVGDLRDQLAALRLKVESGASDSSGATTNNDERIKMLEKQLADSRSEVSRLQTSAATAAAGSADNSDTVRKLIADKSALQSTNDSLEAQLKELKVAKDTAAGELHALQSKAKALESERDAAVEERDRNARYKAKCDTLQDQLAQSSEKSNELETQLSLFKEHLTKKTREYQDAAVKAEKDARATVEQMEAEVKATEQKLKESRKKAQDAESELSDKYQKACEERDSVKRDAAATQLKLETELKNAKLELSSGGGGGSAPAGGLEAELKKSLEETQQQLQKVSAQRDEFESQASQELEKYERDIKLLHDDVATLKSEKQSAIAQVNVYKKALSEKSTEAQEQQSAATASFEKEKAALSDELRAAKSHADTTADKLSRTIAQLEQAQQQLDMSKQVSSKESAMVQDRLQDEVRKRDHQIITLEADTASLKKRLQAAEDGQKEALLQVEAKVKELTSMSSRKSVLESAERDQQDEILKLKSQNTAMKQEISNLENHVSLAAKDKSEIMTEAQSIVANGQKELQKQLDQVNADLTTAKRECRILQEAKESAMAEKSDLESELKAKSSVVSDLQYKLSSATSEVEQMKAKTKVENHSLAQTAKNLEQTSAHLQSEKEILKKHVKELQQQILSSSVKREELLAQARTEKQSMSQALNKRIVELEGKVMELQAEIDQQASRPVIQTHHSVQPQTVSSPARKAGANAVTITSEAAEADIGDVDITIPDDVAAAGGGSAEELAMEVKNLKKQIHRLKSSQYQLAQHATRWEVQAVRNEDLLSQAEQEMQAIIEVKDIISQDLNRVMQEREQTEKEMEMLNEVNRMLREQVK